MKVCIKSRYIPLLLALSGYLIVPCFSHAAPATEPPIRTKKGERLDAAVIHQHDYRWEDPDGFLGRYQSADGKVTVDITVNYFKHAFYAKFYTGDVGSNSMIELPADNSPDPAVLIIPESDGISGRLQKNGTLVLNTPGQKGLELNRIVVGKTNFDPPAGATILLGEGKGVENFRTAAGGDAGWKLLEDGVIESIPYAGSIYSKDSYGDCELYFEYNLPYNARERGNSGAYMMNAYEVQVIDSFGREPTDSIAGSLYKVATPSKNMSAPPLEWQSMYIQFVAPRYDGEGNKIANARASVWHNGVQIQDNVEIPHNTERPTLAEPKGAAPIRLQEHRSYARYRNMWVKSTD